LLVVSVLLNVAEAPENVALVIEVELLRVPPLMVPSRIMMLFVTPEASRLPLPVLLCP
jgi:hypothetical protein